MVSLTEKVEVKSEEETKEAAKGDGDDEMRNASGVVVVLSNKVEDGLSTGSGAASAVVDDQDGPQQLVDSGDSYFEIESDDQYHHHNPGCIGAIDGSVQSEEDDGSEEDGRSYFSDVLVASDDLDHHHHHHHEEEPVMMGWWVWS